MKKLVFFLLLFSLYGLADSSVQILPDKPIQPDYEKWGEIKAGLSPKEVVDILGNPIARFPNSPINSGDFIHMQTWIYGYVVPKTIATPLMVFEINFKNGLVNKIKSPFGGAPLSQNGKPTTPKLIIPDNNFTPSNPSIVDFRWFPSSGRYPMRYILQIQYKSSDGKWEQTTNYGQKSNPITLPYFVVSRKNKFRWRVKAINELGESGWTDFRYIL